CLHPPLHRGGPSAIFSPTFLLRSAGKCEYPTSVQVIKEAWLDGKHRFWLFSRGLFDLKGRNLQRSDLIELN
ncbi:hypothetical protein SOVF_194740 isoform B, partial [Spinacia oleracea]